jgi:hypothetical protein
MNKNQLGKRLRTELGRNKGKSVALGVVCVVALYFWLPLIWGFCRKQEKSTEATANETSDVTVTTISAPPTVEFQWREFLSWRDKEPRMTVAALTVDTRDPFARPQQEGAADSSEIIADVNTDVPEPTPIQHHPSEYGLVLRGTVVGRRGGAANIAGKIYAVGATIRPVSGEDEDSPDDLSHIAYRLVEIDKMHVVLEHEGQLFRLELPTAAGPSTDSITIRRFGQ